MTLDDVTRTAMADVIDDTINAGAGTALLVFETSVPADVVNFSIPNPAFGAGVTGVITLNGVPITSSAASGTSTVAQFRFTDRDANSRITGTVAVSGADINVSSITINDTETYDLTGLTITVPAS